MSYTKEQIAKTADYAVKHLFPKQTKPQQRFITNKLIESLNTFVRLNPLEKKFAIDPKSPVLLRDFFDWIEAQEITPADDWYFVMKRDGTSIADFNGKLTLIYSPKKPSDRAESMMFNDIQEAFLEAQFEDEQYYSSDEQDDEEMDEAPGYDEEGLDMQDEVQPGYDSYEDEDEDEDVVDDEYDSVKIYDEMKARNEDSFRNSIRRDTQRSLYHRVKAEQDQAQKEVKRKAREQRQQTLMIEDRPAVRFKNEKPKTDVKPNLLHSSPPAPVYGKAPNSHVQPEAPVVHQYKKLQKEQGKLKVMTSKVFEDHGSSFLPRKDRW